jgi:hypothetical protein
MRRIEAAHSGLARSPINRPLLSFASRSPTAASRRPMATEAMPSKIGACQ